MPGYLDARGIYHYEEDDPAAPFSDTLNLLAQSTSDRVADIESRAAAVGSAGTGFGIMDLERVTLGTGGTTWARGIEIGGMLLWWGGITLGTGGTITGAVTFVPWAAPSSGPVRKMVSGMPPRAAVGSAACWDVSASRARPLLLVQHNDTRLRILDTTGMDLASGVPHVWAAGDSISMSAVLPVVWT